MPMSPSSSELRLPGPGGRSVPILELDSRREGPLAVVTANLHGDEATGVGTVHALAGQLGPLLRRGRVRLFPTLNPVGLAQGTRLLPGEEVDPNRCFPGDPGGRGAARHAHALWNAILAGGPALVVDLHTDAADAVPYALVDRCVRGPSGVEARSLELAEASGLMVVREYPIEEYVGARLDQSLPGALLNHAGVAAVTLEIGPRRWISPAAVEQAAGAVRRVLGAAGLLDPVASAGEGRARWRRVAGPRPAQGGVFVPSLRSGDAFEIGTPLAEIRSLSGRVVEVLRAPVSGVLLALAERAWAVPGAALLTLAVPDL